MNALCIDKPEPKPRARAEQFLGDRLAWYLWVGDELVDVTFSAFVAETFVDAMNNHPNPFDVNPQGTLS